MKIKKLFENTPAEFFREDRRQAYENLLSGIRVYLDRYEGEICYNSLHELCSHEMGLWKSICQWYGSCSGPFSEPDRVTGFHSSTLSPFADDSFNLDGEIALLNDGIDIFDKLEDIGENGKRLISTTLRDRGLHGLHFLCGVANMEDRIKSVRLICMLLHAESTMWESTGIHTEIQCQSVTKFAFKDEEIKELGLDVVEFNEVIGYPNLEYQDIEIKMASLAQKWWSRKGKVYNEMTDADRYIIAHNLLIPFAYNHGYSLKASGLSDDKVVKAITPIINAILIATGFNQESFSNDLVRQIMINVLSAFTNASVLSPAVEEFQGAARNVNVDDLRASIFKAHFGGPLTAYIDNGSTQPPALVDQVLAENGIKTTYDIARNGFVQHHHAVAYLLNKQNGYSRALELDLENSNVSKLELTKARGNINFNAYSVKSLVNWVYLHVNNILENYPGESKGNPTINSIMERQLISHIKLLYKARPDVKEEVERAFLKSNFVTPKAFRLMGFGYDEMRRMGSEAPPAIKRAILSEGLSL